MSGDLIETLEDRRAAADAMVANRARRLSADAEALALAAHWCDLHPVLPGQRAQQVGADGTPEVAQFTMEEMSCVLGVHTQAAHVMAADALNLRHRHPELWQRLQDCQVVDWVATRTSRRAAAAGLSLEQARWVDQQTAPFVTCLPVSRYLELVEAKIIEADPAAAEARREAEMLARFVRTGQSSEHGIKTLVARATAGEVIYVVAVVQRIADILALQGDTEEADIRRSKAFGLLASPERVLELYAWAEQHAHQPEAPEATPKPSRAPRPPATLHVHVSAEAVAAGSGVARIEQVGPVALDAVRELLGHTQVSVKPVIDLTGQAAVDRYEIPGWLREKVELRFPFEVFPFGTISSRSADKDHTTPYQSPTDGGPPGQTSDDNLAPLGRRAHRIKTIAPGWRHLRLGPRAFLWRTPSGYWLRVDPDGTHALGTQVSIMEEHLAELLRAA